MCWRPPKFWVVKPMVFRVFPSSFQKFPPFSSSRQVWSVSILPTATVMILRPPDPGYFGNPPTDLLMFSMNMYEPSNSLAMLVLKFDSPPWKNDKQWHIQWVFVHDVSTIKLAVWSRSVVCSDNVPRVAKRWRLSAWDFCSPPIIPIIHQTHHPSFSQCQYDSMASLGPANHGTFFCAPARSTPTRAAKRWSASSMACDSSWTWANPPTGARAISSLLRTEMLGHWIPCRGFRIFWKWIYI